MNNRKHKNRLQQRLLYRIKNNGFQLIVPSMGDLPPPRFIKSMEEFIDVYGEPHVHTCKSAILLEKLMREEDEQSKHKT